MAQEDTIQTRELWVSDKFSFKAGVTPTAVQTGWSVSNNSTDRSIDANAPAAVGDGLCTLIEDLITKGIISA